MEGRREREQRIAGDMIGREATMGSGWRMKRKEKERRHRRIKQTPSSELSAQRWSAKKKGNKEGTEQAGQ